MPYNYIFDEVKSPFAYLLKQGAFENFCFLCNDLMECARRNGVIPFSQNLAGIHLVELRAARTLPPGDPFRNHAVKVGRIMGQLYEAYRQVNMRASTGQFTTPVVERETNNVQKSNLSTFASQQLKDVIVSLTDHKGGLVADVHGGAGHTIYAMARMGVVDFKEYVNVDSSPVTDGLTMNQVMAKFPTIQQRVSNVKCSIGEYVRDSHPNLVNFFSMHTVYQLDHKERNALVRVCAIEEEEPSTYSGVAHFSDLLFFNSNVERDADVNLVLNGTIVTGTIGKYNLSPEEMLFTDDVGRVYPACFMHSLREPLAIAPVIANSLAFWSPALNQPQITVKGRKSDFFRMLPANGYPKFRRNKMVEIDAKDFYYLNQMGYYVSHKLDGIAGSLSYHGGAYYVSLRDGLQSMIVNADGTPPNWGTMSSGSVNIELFHEQAGDTWTIYYVGHSPPKYPADQTKRVNYWRDKFTPFSKVLTKAQSLFHGMGFKDYWYVKPHETGKSYPASFVPADGVIFQCPFANYTGFWKPWRTIDLKIVRNDDELIANDANGDSWEVDDFSCKFIHDGIYECIAEEGQIKIVHPRLDKVTLGVWTPPVGNVFSVKKGRVKFAGNTMKYTAVTIKDHIKRATAAYAAAMTSINHVGLGKAALQVHYDAVMSHLRVTSTRYKKGYLSSDFVTAILLKTGFNPQKLWLSFIRFNIMPSETNPFAPVIDEHNGVMRAFVNVK